MKTSRCISGLILVLCFLSLAFASDNSKHSQIDGNTIDVVRGEIEQRIAILLSSEELIIQNEQISSKIVLPALYKQFTYRPVWANGTSVEQLFFALETIDGDGLEAADYHLSLLKKIQAQLMSEKHASPSLIADFDLLLSDSLVRLAYHLLIGKVDPVELDTNWNMDRTVGDLDQVIQKATSAIAEGSVDRLIEAMRPQSETYRRMRSALSHYRNIQEKGGWEPIDEGTTLKLGVNDSRIILLRKRLMVTQDMADENPEDPFFDQTVEEAVKNFQTRHALLPDGIVGKNTLQELNLSVEEKIGQIRVNLERARWVLRDLPEKFVLVDIAGFQAQYFANRSPVFATRTQVGTAYRKTPVFKSRITYLELNPTWTVPETIFLKDILPKVKENTGYLQSRGLRVITYEGKNVDESTIDWSKYPDTGFPYLLRQDPGPGNALGQIKFMFPNEHAVYLHDTPSRYLFGETKRAFSSGCVRIEDPFELAELLLDDEKWNRNEFKKIIESREITQISLKNPVTVLLLYWTVMVGEDGTVIFKKDIYERDQNVLSGLNAQFKFRERPILN